MLQYKSHLLALLATLLVAGSFLVSAQLAGVINSFSLTLLRFCIAASILLPLVLVKASYRHQLRSVIPRSMVISFFYSVYFISLFEALETTTALNTGTLYTLVPFVTACLSVLLFKEKMTVKRLVIYCVAAGGTTWVVFGGKLNSLLSMSLNKGDLIFMCGLLAMCGYSISMKKLYRDDDMIVLVFCTLVGGSFWIALALVFSDLELHWGLLKGESILYMAYLAIAATLVSSYLLQVTTVDLGPSRVMAYSYLNPALVAVLVLVVEGTPIHMIVVPGIILSTVATIALQTSKIE